MNHDQTAIAAWTALLAMQPSDRTSFLRTALAHAVATEGAEVKPVSSTRRTAPAARTGPATGAATAPPTIARSACLPHFDPLVASPAIEPQFRPPLIGGPALILQPSKQFRSRAFTRRWVPGQRVLVYLAGCRGLKDLVKRLDQAGSLVYAFKVGTVSATAHDLGLRMREISADNYAGAWLNGKIAAEDAGFGGWSIEPLRPDFIELAPGSPVRISFEAIEVTLPDGMKPIAFDQLLNKALCAATLANFVLSAAGRALCEAVGENHRPFIRYSLNGSGKPQRATEITIIKPRHGDDLTRLIRVIEEILFQYVADGSAPSSSR